MKKRLLLAALAMLPMFAYSQATPEHEMYVKIGSETVPWGTAYERWQPGKAFYEGLDEEATENENFNISRIKPRKRFTNAQTQVRVDQTPDRKLLWWCPVGGEGWNALSSCWFGGEVWTMWSYTDIWGNWTAPLMSMPAPMLDVCHKNGVQISCLAPIAWAATIRPTDTSGYGHLMNKILSDAGGYNKFLKFLKYYGIDGLGFNSEFSWVGNVTGAGYYSGQPFHTAMKNFLGDCYTNAESYGVPFHNCWYSLTGNQGNMGGGDDLNDANKDWFDYNGKPTSTAYFTNYGASLTTSQNTVERNFPNRSSYDVYMGIDYQASYDRSSWLSLKNLKISIGIWGAHNRNQIYESRQENGSDPFIMQETYQKILENVFTGSTKNPVNPPPVTSKTRFNSKATNAYGWAQFIVAKSTLTPQDGGDLSTDPFVTNFNLGNGMFFNVAGERQSNTEWYNIGVQDYMPTWRWWFTNTYMGRTEAEVSPDLSAKFTWDDAYFGGSCLEISGGTDVTYTQLFKTKYPVINNDYFTVRYKVLSGEGKMSLAVSTEAAPTTEVSATINASMAPGNGWQEKEIKVATRGGVKIGGETVAQIGLKFENTSDDFKVLIGQISLTRGKVGTYEKPQMPVVEKAKLLAHNYKGVDMKIIYNMDHAYSGPAKEAYEPVYNSEVQTSHFRVYTQQEGKEAKAFLPTTSWAAYVVSAPYVVEDGGRIRIGVAAVSLDAETESDIAWGEWIDLSTMEPTIVEGTEIDKPIIKANEEFTLKYVDVNHAAAKWEIINSLTGETVRSYDNVTSIKTSLPTIGSYDVKITNADNSVAYTRGIIQVSPESTGAIPTLGDMTISKNNIYPEEEITLSSSVERLGEGTVSRAVKVEDPNLLRFPEVVGSRPYTYAMWFKVDKYTHGKEGTNLIDKRSFDDTWPHNNWGDLWVTIRTQPTEDGQIPRRENGSYSTSPDRAHDANEISFNTYGWTEHDAPDTDMMSNYHSVNEGQWTHLAVTFDTDGRQKMYFNGKKVAEKVTQHITNNGVRKPGSNVYIGGTSVYKGGFNGWVDEFQVWDRVLTDSEVQTAMNGFTTAPAGLQGYWTFEDKVLSSNGNNVFPNKGQKGASYTAAVISVAGQNGENTQSTVETVLDGTNEELGNPIISGTLNVTTSSEWSLPDAISTENGTEATVSYNAAGTYTAGLTLKNMWGSDTKTAEVVVVPFPTGVEEAEVELAGVYPNPFTDYVNLYFAKEGNYTIEIIALDGKLIESKDVTANDGEVIRLDVNGDKGMYIVKVMNADNTAVRTLKVVKK